MAALSAWLDLPLTLVSGRTHVMHGAIHLCLFSAMLILTWVPDGWQLRSPPDFFMKARRKSERPTKVCLVCGRPFTWRKKWERDWEHVKYCSERCQRSKSSVKANVSVPD